ncbi:hypothetical protein BDZ91DRAFT_791289 [Kalaharituber pfeilii]|nr:hypothetical protein BDZ91DRAFT_791289 [Kalaharituber pfeilii]
MESQNSLPVLMNDTISDLAHTAQNHDALAVDDAYRLIVCSLNATKKLPLLDADWMQRTLTVLTVDSIKPDFAKLNQYISLISHMHPLYQSPTERFGEKKRLCSAVTNIVLQVIELCDKHLRATVDDMQVQQHISRTRELILTRFQVLQHGENTPDHINGGKESSEVSLCSTNLADISITDTYRLLQDPAININERDELGLTALENAAYHGRIGVVMLLLLHGAKLGDQGAKKPLYWALEGGKRSDGTVEITCLEIIRMFINQGAPVCSKQVDEGDAQGDLDVAIMWVKAHREIRGNTDADRAAKIGTALQYQDEVITEAGLRQQVRSLRGQERNRLQLSYRPLQRLGNRVATLARILGNKGLRH